MESLDCIVIRLELMLFAALSDKTNYMIEVAVVLKSESFFRKPQCSDALFILFGQTDFLPIFQEFLQKQDREWKILSSKNCFSNFSWNSFDFESSDQYEISLSKIELFIHPDSSKYYTMFENSQKMSCMKKETF